MSEAVTPEPGDYAIVELFGHTTLVGRISEIERFGTKMLAIEPLFRDALLPAVFHHGAAIYRLIPCTAAVAYAQQPRRAYSLPPTIRCIVPELLLAAPDGTTVAHDDGDDGDDDGDDDDDRQGEGVDDEPL